MELREPHNLVTGPPSTRRRTESVTGTLRLFVRRRPHRVGRRMHGAVRHTRPEHVASRRPAGTDSHIDKIGWTPTGNRHSRRERCSIQNEALHSTPPVIQTSSQECPPSRKDEGTAEHVRSRSHCRRLSPRVRHPCRTHSPSPPLRSGNPSIDPSVRSRP